MSKNASDEPLLAIRVKTSGLAFVVYTGNSLPLVNSRA